MGRFDNPGISMVLPVTVIRNPAPALTCVYLTETSKSRCLSCNSGSLENELGTFITFNKMPGFHPGFWAIPMIGLIHAYLGIS